MGGDRNSIEPKSIGLVQLLLAMMIASLCSVAGALIGILLALEFDWAETPPAIAACMVGSAFGLAIVEGFEGIPVSRFLLSLLPFRSETQ